MIKRYVTSLKSLLDNLHSYRRSPYSHIEKWLLLQMKLLKKVTYLETRIQKSKLIIGQLKRNLKTPSGVKSKAESIVIKSKINTQFSRIEDYKFLILCFKSIADGIAFTFINKFDIKPQNFKEKTGFLVGKEGLKMELKTLKYSYKRGLIAILNDLTTVLKYNDLTILTSKEAISVEVKSSALESSRNERQKVKSEKLFNYLDTGETTELYGFGGTFLRQSMETPERHYSKKLNWIIDKSKKDGVAHLLIEPGLVYFVCHLPELVETELDIVKEKYSIEAPLFHSLNSNKFHGEGYYPFSLNLRSDNYLDLLLGEYVVLILLDLKRIESVSLRKGFKAKYVHGKDWVFEFYRFDGEKALVMSNHLLGRVFAEFISPKQLIEDGFLQYDKMMKQYETAHNNSIAKSRAGS